VIRIHISQEQYPSWACPRVESIAEGTEGDMVSPHHSVAKENRITFDALIGSARQAGCSYCSAVSGLVTWD